MRKVNIIYKKLLKQQRKLSNITLIYLFPEYNKNFISQSSWDVNKELENESLKRRVAELEREVREKDMLLEERETSFLEKLKRSQERNLELEREINKHNENAMKIESLRKKLEIKENELKMNKDYYEEKIKELKSVQKQQKKDWSKIYNELYEEIKVLKGEMEDISMVKDTKSLRNTAAEFSTLPAYTGGGGGGTSNNPSRWRDDFLNSGKLRKYEEVLCD